MTASSPDLSEDEAQIRYPDLMRARNLYSTLFKDQSPLVHLGYVGNQAPRAYRVLSLLPKAGKIYERVRGQPELTIESERSSDEEVVISHLPSKKSFSLTAYEDQPGSGNLAHVLASRHHNVLFDELPEKVAHVGLFAPDADLSNLDFLVKELLPDLAYTKAPLGLHFETGLTRPLGKSGIIGTYKAAWVDEQAKHEFVAKIDIPENRGTSLWVRFRKLKPISDCVVA